MRLGTRCACLVLLACLPSSALELVSTRTTGQYRVQATPVDIDFDADGVNEWIVLGEQGQVMVWKHDLSDWGDGQDGAVAMLPDGMWTSSPAVCDASGATRLVFVNTDGNVVTLDEKFAPAWQVQLPGKTMWSRATPVVVAGVDGALLVIGDLSGAVTALRPDGSVAWEVPLSKGTCGTLLQTYSADSGPRILAPCGNTLLCLDAGGETVWSTDLGEGLTARPEVFDLPQGPHIVAGGAQGMLAVLDLDGNVVRRMSVGDEIDSSITLLPREGWFPLIVVTGLWGNLYAFDVYGNHVWTHLFRAKNRARPVVFDVDQDGFQDVVVATYGQHAYAINAMGRRIDEVRLAGSVNAFPVLLHEPGQASPDIVFVTGVLLAHRFRIGPPQAVYGSLPREPAVNVYKPTVITQRALIRDNPRHHLVCANAVVASPDGRQTIAAAVSARGTIVIPLPDLGPDDTVTLEELGLHTGKKRPLPFDVAPATTDAGPAIRAWATLPYSEFDPTRVAPHPIEHERLTEGIVIGPLYRGEYDQGACIIASRLDEAAQTLVGLDLPKRDDGTAFPGTIVLRRVVMTPTANGEDVADALPELGDDRLIQLLPNTAVKLWISTATGDAAPGAYTGKVHLRPIHAPEMAVDLPLRIVVSNIEMPETFPLTFCTWDYLPNSWFPTGTAEILGDMAAHGVNVFPRSSMPQATYADESLTLDWTPLDQELDRLAGRGEILFHVVEPPIQGLDAVAPADREPICAEYLLAFRDHLHGRGLNYNDYAFYPVDEPGLDYGTRVPVYIAAAERFRAADAQFRVYTDPVPGLSWQDYRRIAPLVDVWCPNMRLVSGLLVKDPRIEDIMASGKPVWSYECVSQVKSLSPLRYNRANAWRALYFGLDGIGHWTFSTTQANHWFANADKNDEYALVYPGERPVPSARWEAVRDGLEDIAALTLLQEQIARVKHAGAAPEKVTQAEDFVTGALIDVMELSDEAFIESRDFLKQGDRRLWHTWWDAVLYHEIRNQAAALTEELAAL